MSALVLKICSEYAKALGLNFPPCVQQEINAIAQYVDLHTVKDLKVEQNGIVVTITCFTEGGQEKVFTITLPEVNVDTLSALIKGSSSVVVDKSEDGKTLVVRLDKSQEVQYVEARSGRPLTEEQLTILKANKANQIIYYGGVKYYFKLAYEKSSTEWIYATFVDSATTLTVNMTNGSAVFDIRDSMLYSHHITIVYADDNNINRYLTFTIYSTSIDKLITSQQLINTIGNNKIQICSIQDPDTGEYGVGTLMFYGSDKMNIIGVIGTSDSVSLYDSSVLSIAYIVDITDDVTEV